jgi:stage II sporulation protein P
MKRQAPKRIHKKWADTTAIALVFAIPLAASAFGDFGLFSALGMGAAELSATMIMPEAGVSAIMDEVYAALDEDSSDQPEYFVDNPSKPQDDALAGLSDLEKASALIPEPDRMPIETTQYASSGRGDNYFSYGNGSIRNNTQYPNSGMLQAAGEAMPFGIELGSSEPQVLIVHTHITESYDRFDAGFYDVNYPTRSTEITENMGAVGKVAADTLNALGINTLQITEYYDYPSYTGAYSRSAETVKAYLARYPSIKVVLDLHRDGIQREDGTRLKPTAMINGKKAAQFMIVCCAGTDEEPVPEFRENLKFAARLQDSAQTLYPGLTRPVFLTHRYYNQDLSPGSLLIEIGSESNTLAEAKYTGELLARSLAGVFR